MLADVISCLGMTMSVDGSRDCLNFRLIGSGDEIGSWGHEYVRHLSGEIAAEYTERMLSGEDGLAKPVDDLISLAKEIVPFCMAHNGEAEACDLLMELERLSMLPDFVDKESFPRVCLYLTSCVKFVAEPEDSQILKCALSIFRKFDRLPEAIKLALQLNDMDLVKEIFEAASDSSVKKQLAFILGRQQINLEDDDDDEINEILSNTQLSSNFFGLVRELDIMEAKTPEDIYKSHLEPTRSTFGSSSVDSARQNLASTFVNAFVNAGYGQDKLMIADGNKWLYKNKEHGMLSAAASLGMILLWDVDGGLTQIDKFLYSSEDLIRAGALLACGIVNAGVRNDCDPALALLSDYVLHSSNIMRVGSVLGLGLAYAGSARKDVTELLGPVLSDSKSNMEVVGVSALALGFINVGTCDGEVASMILQAMMEKTEDELKETYSRYLSLGLGLLYLGKQDACEETIVTLEAIPDPVGKFSRVLVDVCAYAGTGNVLKVQNLLHLCSEHFDTEKEGCDDSHQSMAVIGIALVAMGEDIGIDMCIRSLSHLLQYGELAIRRMVPLAMSLLCASNPKLNVLDVLSKLSHDGDAEVAHNSILAMGIVGAGTNNARIAAMLRQLAVYYGKEPNNLFIVRLSQGLLHMGKGTMSICPFHEDRQLMSNVSVSGLLAVLVACMDIKNTILGKSHYILYSLVLSMYPRMLMCFDEELNPLQVSVRVGQAVDVVGQAGKPKTITGFQTHTTPVLLAYGERAELATEEYIPQTNILEGFVILKKNPEFEAVHT